MTHPKRAALAAALHLALFGAVVAWSQEEPAQAPALVSPLAAVVGQPFATGPIDGSIPPIDATGFLQEPAVSLLSPLVAHEGRFTWGLDLPTQPINIFITTSESTWKTLFDPGAPILEHTASPKLPVYMNGILDEAHAHQDEFKTAVAGVDKVLEEFAHVLDPALAAIPDSPASSFFGYRPLRARWLHSRWWAPELIPLPEVELVYPDYSGFGDVRQRGARLYCAARRGQREQDQALQQGKPATSLGERAAFSFNLLGQTIDLLALTSTVVFNGPQRCIGGGADAPACAGASGPAPADGAQAFEIPLLLGHRLTPIRGLGLPGLPEVQVPLVLVSGDSEVQTATDKRAVFLGFDSPCPACAPQPKFEVMHSKAYRTVSHADAALSASRGYHLAGSFPFFLLGPVVVSFDLNFDYTFGELLNPHDRVIQTDPPLSLWPKPTRPGWLFSNGTGGVRYHEGPWRLQATRIGGQPALTWTVLPHGMTSSLWREPLLPFFRPHDLQALTDDDHALRSRTHVKLGGAISGQLGADIGPFETTLTVKGGLTATLDHDHVVRDALMAQAPPPGGLLTLPMRPITALSVRGAAESSLEFTGLSAKLHFELDLFLTDIEFDKQLFSTPAVPLAPPASTDSLLDATLANDDRLALRLGTGSRDGQPMLKPAVASHLPQGPDFGTFDVDVPTCLADDTPNSTPPDPCPGEKAEGGPPQAHVCLYGPSSLLRPVPIHVPLGVCANITGYLNSIGLTGARRSCIGRYLAFMCAPTSKTQSYKGEIVVSRLWDLNPLMQAELYGIVDACVTAFIPPGPGAQGQAKAFVMGLLSGAVCEADATNLTSDQVFSFLGSGPPAATPAAACAN